MFFVFNVFFSSFFTSFFFNEESLDSTDIGLPSGHRRVVEDGDLVQVGVSLLGPSCTSASTPWGDPN